MGQSNMTVLVRGHNQVLRNTMERRPGTRISADYSYKGAPYNVISITRGGRVSTLQKKVLCNTLMVPYKVIINKRCEENWLNNKLSR